MRHTFLIRHKLGSNADAVFVASQMLMKSVIWTHQRKKSAGDVSWSGLCTVSSLNTSFSCHLWIQWWTVLTNLSQTQTCNVYSRETCVLVTLKSQLWDVSCSIWQIFKSFVTIVLTYLYLETYCWHQIQNRHTHVKKQRHSLLYKSSNSV